MRKKDTKEHFSVSNKECSDTSINDAIFEYSLSKLNQIKTPN